MKTASAKASAVREGSVLIIGRPNVGKSTFLNNLIGQKVAITSPKPQTTRFPINAIYEEERGRINFVDTPGIFGRTGNLLSKRINQNTLDVIGGKVNAVIYMIDATRRRDFEEGKVLGIVRKMEIPKILVINKVDLEQVYAPQYKFLEQEFKKIYSISALQKKHIGPLVDELFDLMPEAKKGYKEKEVVYPATNISSKLFLAELIREKVFLQTGDEIPYTTTAVVDEVEERKNKVIVIKARILTTNTRYKKMLIGAGGRKIKEIGSMARKEIELATKKKIFLDLTVEVDPHWQSTYYS